MGMARMDVIFAIEIFDYHLDGCPAFRMTPRSRFLRRRFGAVCLYSGLNLYPANEYGSISWSSYLLVVSEGTQCGARGAVQTEFGKY